MPYLVYPQLPHDDVVYSDHHLGPGVVVTRPVEHEVRCPNGVHEEVLPPELGGYTVLLPVRPVLMFHIHGTHGRMVPDLWREGGGKRGEIAVLKINI